MRIGIDISQLAYPKTGVAVYLKNLVEHLLREDADNDYILFFSSLRGKFPDLHFQKNSRVTVKQFTFPPTLLDILWNTLHIVPIEWLIGSLDIFISSDWTQPPSRARKVAILYDLIVYKYPKETARQIVAVQKKRLAWVKKEIDMVFCISQATKKDAMEILGIPDKKIAVVYPGL